MDLFNHLEKINRKQKAPLAERMRPQNLNDYVGQKHLLDEGRPLYRMIKSGKIASMIFYGPPGTGKTSLAYIIAKYCDSLFESISAVTSGVKEMRMIFQQATEHFQMYGKKTILFIDEIHRFNKGQQDALLSYVENGIIILIGATTENPYFEINKALLSRCHIVELKSLLEEDIMEVIKKAILKDPILRDMNISISEKVMRELARHCGGDVRSALNTLEIAVLSTDSENGKIIITEDSIYNSSFERGPRYDKTGDDHYDTISAFIKSMRGSDPAAALFYLSRMLIAGEDPLFIARRMIIFASEDIGNADPQALTVAVNTFQAVHYIGMPESRIILSQACCYLSTALKSNRSYVAIEKAWGLSKENMKITIPNYLRDAHYQGAQDLGRGVGYIYPHDSNKKQNYLPLELSDFKEKFYEPIPIGYEKIIFDRIKNSEEETNDSN